MNKTQTTTKGFTLAQLLVLLAILAVIVIISVPIFTRELERSLETTDFSTVRTVYAEFMADIVSGDEDAVINDIPIKQSDDTYRVAVYPLAQRMDGWSIRIDNKKVGGVDSSEWIGTPRKYGACIISYFPESGRTTIHWGTGFPLMSLKQLHAVDNRVRVREDQRLLRALGQEILGKYWTVDKLRRTLALPEEKDADAEDATKAGAASDADAPADTAADAEAVPASGGPIRIADYYQLKKNADTSSGFRIVSTRSTALEELLRAAGYEPGATRSSRDKGKKGRSTTYQYSLFFSDELAANHYGGYSSEPARRSIFIDDIQVKDDVVTQLTIYIKAMDDQAVMTDTEESQFRITVN